MFSTRVNTVSPLEYACCTQKTLQKSTHRDKWEIKTKVAGRVKSCFHQAMCIQRMFLLVGRYQAIWFSIWFSLGSRYGFNMIATAVQLRNPVGVSKQKTSVRECMLCSSAHCAEGKTSQLDMHREKPYSTQNEVANVVKSCYDCGEEMDGVAPADALVNFPFSQGKVVCS